MQNLTSFVRRKTADEKATSSFIQFGTIAVIVLVAVFGDVMFIKLMWNKFPDGILRYGAIGGAIATALSILLLVYGKKAWFRPGKQLKFAYFFTACEVAVSILNVLLASGVSQIAFWQDFAPATPFIAMVGWIIIWQLDSTTKELHEDMEMEDELKEATREYIREQHNARLEIQYRALEYNKQYMLEALETPHNQQEIAKGADAMTRNAIHGLTGRFIPGGKLPVQGSIQEQNTDPLSLPSLHHSTNESNGNH